MQEFASLWNAVLQYTQQGKLIGSKAGEFWVGLMANNEAAFWWLDGTPFDYTGGESP